jgi:1-acyl-sn-glycerol-3-phosphate acyltransferase
MTEKKTIRYPRRKIRRGLSRAVGRAFLGALFKVEVSGEENYPLGGPLIVVGNHVAVMESVLMTVKTPWAPEMLGSEDIPHEKLSAVVMAVYGSIPIRRGSFERASMNLALDVLHQDGILGLFPEGGIWEPGAMRPQTGVAWLSYRGKAPVLPTGYGGTRGALGAALKGKRPQLTMAVGPVIAPCVKLPGVALKPTLEAYALKVMDAVYALIPDDQKEKRDEILDEQFSLEYRILNRQGDAQTVPPDLQIVHQESLAKFLHRPGILKLLIKNLELPVECLQELDTMAEAGLIAKATRSVLDYLRDENPYLLSYRFGPKQAEAMESGIRELAQLSTWAHDQGFALQLVPIRRYYCPDRGETVVQTKQEPWQEWR